MLNNDAYFLKHGIYYVIAVDNMFYHAWLCIAPILIFLLKFVHEWHEIVSMSITPRVDKGRGEYLTALCC